MSIIHFALIFPIRVFTAFVRAFYHSWFKLRWCPSSQTWLMEIDAKIRSFIKHRNHGEWVVVTLNDKAYEVWTVFVEGDRSIQEEQPAAEDELYNEDDQFVITDQGSEGERHVRGEQLNEDDQALEDERPNEHDQCLDGEDSEENDQPDVGDEHRNNKKVPVVLLHGTLGGCDLFLNNIDSIAKHRDVYMIDLPGFGLSSKPDFRVKYQNGWWVDKDENDIEMFFTELLERWLIKMDLKKIILLGHGLGGYISAVYCMSYPRRVAHLILSEPWGFKSKPAAADGRPFQTNKFISLFSGIYRQLYLFTPLRVLGPLALPLFRIFRLRIKEKFMAVFCNLDPETTPLQTLQQLMVEERAAYFPDMTMQDYCYLWMINSSSGEVALDHLSKSIGWPCLPLEERVDNWVCDLDVSFIFGSRSWVDQQCGWEAKNHRHESCVDVHVIGGAGHHMYMDRPAAFNNLVQRIGEAVDGGLKLSISNHSLERKNSMSQLRRRLSVSLSESVMEMDEALMSDLRASGAWQEEAAVVEGATSSASVKERKTVVFTLEPRIEEENDDDDDGLKSVRNLHLHVPFVDVQSGSRSTDRNDESERLFAN